MILAYLASITPHRIVRTQSRLKHIPIVLAVDGLPHQHLGETLWIVTPSRLGEYSHYKSFGMKILPDAKVCGST